MKQRKSKTLNISEIVENMDIENWQHKCKPQISWYGKSSPTKQNQEIWFLNVSGTVNFQIVTFTQFAYKSYLNNKKKINLSINNQSELLDKNNWYHVCKISSISWYHITVCQIFLLDRNTWNHISVCNIFVLDRNTWYYITVS